MASGATGRKSDGSERSAFEDSIRETLHDVFHLETNTIICEEITARRMPPTAHALLDVAQAYAGFLARHNANLQPLARITTNPCTFFLIAKAAKQLLDTPVMVQALTHRDRAVVQRIRRSSIHLTFLILRMADLSFDITSEGTSDEALERIAVAANEKEAKGTLWNATRQELYRLGAEGETEPKAMRPQDRAAVRKIWEVRVEHVAMQSVVQLDGDIVTRVQEYYATENCAWLHDLHRQGVGTSIAMWHHLVETLCALAAGAMSAFAAVLRR